MMTPGVVAMAICDAADCKACRWGLLKICTITGICKTRWATLHQVRGGLLVFVVLPPPLSSLYLFTTPVEGSCLGSRVLCIVHAGGGGWLNPLGLQGCFTPWQQSEAPLLMQLPAWDMKAGKEGEQGKVSVLLLCWCALGDVCRWAACICQRRTNNVLSFNIRRFAARRRRIGVWRFKNEEGAGKKQLWCNILTIKIKSKVCMYNEKLG